MAKSKQVESYDVEIQAIGAVHDALKNLNAGAQTRVLKYVVDMLSIPMKVSSGSGDSLRTDSHKEEAASSPVISQSPDSAQDEFEGVSPIAIKWARRAGFDSAGLQKLFSLGVDEIDFVAKKVPGKSKKERMRNVLLLKGIAAYLGTGASRVTYEQLKEAAIHYDAYDGGNFAAYLRSFASEVGGSKDAGLTLTARGLTSATELVSTMIAAG